ncbi:MAG TPA: hypothetical protein VGP63_03335 [Planctomycetaceae bacterium]|jgi:hypothetical protein|nr:hypothetical protein [Planctomycetaceae bacterium]
MSLLKPLVVAYAVFFSEGCSLPMVSKAEYDNGFMFEGANDVIYSVGWYAKPHGPDGPSTHCSLVLHLDDGTDLDESTFASPVAMRRLGARTQNRFDDEFELVVERQRTWIGCRYRKGKLDQVWLNLGQDGRGKVTLTVNGKNVSLPIK